MFSKQVNSNDILDANGFIYFDWNIFSHIKKYYLDIDKTFLSVLEACNFKIPYSEAHLRDLYKSDELYHNDDLQFVRKITKNTIICCDQNIGFKLVKNQDVICFYKEYGKYLQSESGKELNFSIKDYPVSIINKSELDSSHPMYEMIKNNNFQMDGFVFQKFLENLMKSHFDDNPKDYKIVRTYMREKISDMKKYANNEIISNFLEKYESYLNNFNISSFRDCLNAFCTISNCTFESLSLDEQFNKIDLILDFHPDFMDKMKKNNRLTNKENDNRHIYFGLNSKIFVSEDNLIRKKANFIFKFYKKDIKVTDFEDFISMVYKESRNYNLD